jgi:uncharacterized protein (TIGR02145 family)
MLNVLKLFAFALTAITLSCADYPKLDLSVKHGEEIEDLRDGKKYKTIIIGEQEWMAENLNYAKGDTIGLCYDDNPVNCENLGRLYTWAEAMNLDSSFNNKSYFVPKSHRGICPSNWHLPSYDEWMVLLDYVGNKEGLKLKTMNGWEINGTDEYGFSAMPAGFHYEGIFQKLKICGAWWSITEIGNANIKSVQICNDDADKLSFLKASWVSIRCIKD